MLTDAEMSRFREQGFLAVDRQVLSAAQLRKIETLLRPLFDQRDRIPAAWVNDLGDGRSAVIPEILCCARVEPRIMFTSAYRTMRSVASKLVGSRATIAFDHVILKDAGCTGVTPWHQDQAFN